MSGVRVGGEGAGYGRKWGDIMRRWGASEETVAETAEDHEEEQEAEEAGYDDDGDANGEVRFEPGDGRVLDAAGLAAAAETPAAIATLATVDKVRRQDDAVRPPRGIHTCDLAVHRRPRGTRLGERERQSLRLALLVPARTHPRRTLQTHPSRPTVLSVVEKLVVRTVHILPRTSFLLVTFRIRRRSADLLGTRELAVRLTARPIQRITHSAAPELACPGVAAARVGVLSRVAILARLHDPVPTLLQGNHCPLSWRHQACSVDRAV